MIDELLTHTAAHLDGCARCDSEECTRELYLHHGTITWVCRHPQPSAGLKGSASLRQQLTPTERLNVPKSILEVHAIFTHIHTNNKQQ
ncbi:hypothetical protein D3C78_1468580 [compost metagenome]